MWQNLVIGEVTVIRRQKKRRRALPFSHALHAQRHARIGTGTLLQNTDYLHLSTIARCEGKFVAIQDDETCSQLSSLPRDAL